MTLLTTPAIVLRRNDYGDFDLILTVFSRACGKLSLIAKAAKKSRKRFGGVLELFSELEIVARPSRRGSLAVLQEASLREPFANIRGDVQRLAYASYWAELVQAWMEEGARQEPLYDLLRHVLAGLDRPQEADYQPSIVFQMRLLEISGHRPNLEHCGVCGREIDRLEGNRFGVDLRRGGIVCPRCAAPGELQLSRRVVKQLLWVAGGRLERAGRMRFAPDDARQALAFLEAFVPFHLGRQPRSLKFLRQVRQPIGGPDASTARNGAA